MAYIYLLMLLCVVCSLFGFWLGYMTGYSNRGDDERRKRRAANVPEH